VGKARAEGTVAFDSTATPLRRLPGRAPSRPRSGGSSPGKGAPRRSGEDQKPHFSALSSGGQHEKPSKSHVFEHYRRKRAALRREASGAEPSLRSFPSPNLPKSQRRGLGRVCQPTPARHPPQNPAQRTLDGSDRVNRGATLSPAHATCGGWEAGLPRAARSSAWTRRVRALFGARAGYTRARMVFSDRSTKHFTKYCCNIALSGYACSVFRPPDRAGRPCVSSFACSRISLLPLPS
jgi:hypothetical protein